MDRDDCRATDEDGPLAQLREAFTLPEGIVYLDGNSLGPSQPRVLAALDSDASRWRDRLIGGWNESWVELPERTAARLEPLLGARRGEVAVTDSTSVNLFKALVAAAGLRPQRDVVLVGVEEFPTDAYIAAGFADLAGKRVRALPTAELRDGLDDDVAVVLRSQIDYRSGGRADLAEETSQAHEAGAVTVWDLSHTVGVLALDLPAAEVDLAVGCSYKFLNGGPGAPAWIFAAARHHDRLATALRGWFGHADPFAFSREYSPAPGAGRFLAGTPPVLSLAALHAALEVFDGLDMSVVEAAAGSLTALFIALVDERCPGLEVITPRRRGQRGAQVSLRHPEAYALVRALAARGIVGDHRPPDLLRFGFAPLYVRHVDVWDAVEVIAELLGTGSWDRPEFHHRDRVP